MQPIPEQILTAVQMRAAENALIGAGTSVDALMEAAGRGAAEWVWRIAGHHAVTVLCGPGNNGGDGYVIAEAVRERGGKVTVIAASEPRTDAARNARALYRGTVVGPDKDISGDVLVDCLFGSGLSRALADDHVALLIRLAEAHRYRIAVDLPSGVDADSGALRNDNLPGYDLTLALGAWKFAHLLMPACARMGAVRLVEIGIGPVEGGATMIAPPRIAIPAADAHKYRRGLLAVVGGAMPGAAVLAAIAAQRAGAGYVKLFADTMPGRVPPDLVVETGRLSDVLTDDRNTAILAGPGLGRDAKARERLATALADRVPAVVDADALHLFGPRLPADRAPIIATPHEGEFAVMERAFACSGSGSKVDRALALARATDVFIVAKGPGTIIAAPDGRIACAPCASSWLSVAGTGDVLAGIIGSRLATGVEAFEAACEGVWLHAEAARLCGPAFTAGDLANAVPLALAACL